jgi:hypothetical protein
MKIQEKHKLVIGVVGMFLFIWLCQIITGI